MPGPNLEGHECGGGRLREDHHVCGAGDGFGPGSGRTVESTTLPHTTPGGAGQRFESSGG